MTKKTMVVASRNSKKAKEIMEILQGLGWTVMLAAEAGRTLKWLRTGPPLRKTPIKKHWR